MSASKYRWTPACDGQPCVGDCDLCRVDNLQSGIYTDNPDDTLRYVQTTQPVDLWGNPKLADDYVLVVRCEDCKHWDDVPISDERQSHECHLIDCNLYKIRIVTPPDWFCKGGERREK